MKKWKLNIVDIVVILLIVAVAAFFGAKFLRSSNVVPSAGAKTGTITYVVEVSGMTKELYEEVAACIPCPMAASGEWVGGEILEVRGEPCNVKWIESSSPVNVNQTQWVEADPAQEYVTAYFTCQAKIDLNSLLNMVGTQEIRLGRHHYVKSVDIELIGTIVSLEKSEG